VFPQRTRSPTLTSSRHTHSQKLLHIRAGPVPTRKPSHRNRTSSQQTAIHAFLSRMISQKKHPWVQFLTLPRALLHPLSIGYPLEHHLLPLRIARAVGQDQAIAARQISWELAAADRKGGRRSLGYAPIQSQASVRASCQKIAQRYEHQAQQVESTTD